MHFMEGTVMGLMADVPTETSEAIDRGMDKEVVVYIYNGILLSHKKE